MRHFLVLFIGLLVPGLLVAQEASEGSSAFSVEEAIQFALENHQDMKTARLDVESSDARVSEVAGAGLPQVSASAQYMNNMEVQTQFIPGDAFSEGFGDFAGVFQTVGQLAEINNVPYNPPAVGGGPEIQETNFGVTHMGDAKVEASQLLFSGSYIIGLKAAKTYKELTKKQSEQTARDVAFNVSKAYYSALVVEKRIGMLDANIMRLDSVLHQTRVLNENGFAEDIEVQRLEVQLNNLKSEKTKTNQLVEISKKLLNFQMGRDVKADIQLKDTLSDAEVSNTASETTTEVNYEDRIEYSILETQQNLAELDIKNNQASALPTLSAFGQGGYNIGRNRFSEWWNFQDWQPYLVVGVNLQWNIFTGLQRHNKLQQARIAHRKTQVGFETLKRSMDLEAEQANTNLENALKDLEIQQANMDLAKEVARVSSIKYQEGVGSNLEVVNAESDYKEARVNYYDALYNVLIYKLELDKALGRFDYPQN